MIPYACPVCDHAGNAPDDALGKRVACPACKTPFRIDSATMRVPTPATKETPATPTDIELLQRIDLHLAALREHAAVTRSNTGCLLWLVVAISVIAVLAAILQGPP